MPGPVAVPRARPPRLASVNDKHTYRASQSQPASKPAAKPSQCCDDKQVEEVDGIMTCINCGAVASESQIVSDVMFGETASGAATVQGGFVGDDQRHANSMGGTMRGLAGQGSREHALMNGREEIRKLCAALNLRTLIEDQAFNMYKLAWTNSFIKGRRVRDVAAICIYFTSRRQPENTLLLMDLAERIQVNVWDLGASYTAYLKQMMFTDPALSDGSRSVQEIEPLMLKYCRKLEFGQYSHKVADDACKLLRRMNRDWIVQGRQPAGICGACIILAARMNNFRRTVREVVLVVRVADTTIHQRLHEYKRTPTSALTVDQFREFGHRVKTTTLPPSIYRRIEKEEREQELKRKATEEVESELAENEHAPGEEDEAGSSTTTKRRSTPKKRKTNKGTSQAIEAGSSRASSQTSRRDEDGFLVPDLPTLEIGDGTDLDALAASMGDVDAPTEPDTNDGDFQLPKKRGRKPKKRAPIEVPPEELEIEEDLEQEVEHYIQDWESTFKEIKDNHNHEVLLRADGIAQELAQKYRGNADISMDPELGNDEYEDDPDVANCVLNPEEVKMRDRVWTLANEDWLREQQRKLHIQALEEARGILPKPKKTRRRNQMGDGSVLGGQPAASPADAAQMMMKKRAKGFSTHINYEKLKDLFPGSATASEAGTDDAESTAPSSRQTTQAPATNPATPVAVPVVEEGDEDDDGEEYEEEYAEAEDEEFDDPQNYADDDDEGFGNETYDDDY